MLMQLRLTTTDLFFIGIGFGAIFGLIPLILGLFKKRVKLGVIGFVSSVIVGGVIWSILALVVSGVFVWLILKKPITETPVEAASSDENPTEINADSRENS